MNLACNNNSITVIIVWSCILIFISYVYCIPNIGNIFLSRTLLCKSVK